MKKKNVKAGKKINNHKQENSTSVLTGSCCLDELSTLCAVKYEDADIIKDFLANGKEIVTAEIKKMKLDQFNDGFFDEYIKHLICLGLNNIEEQRISHESAITDIRIGQESKLGILKNELALIESELESLKMEV